MVYSAPPMIAGASPKNWKMPQLPNAMGAKVQDRITGGMNNLAGAFVKQGTPQALALESQQANQYGQIDPTKLNTPEDYAVLSGLGENPLAFQKKNAVDALRKNQGASNALKLGVAGAGLAYLLGGGDIGTTALGGLAGAGAGSLLNRKTALQKLEDYTNIMEANKLNQGYADTMKQQSFDEASTVDALAMGGGLTKAQSMQMKKIVTAMQNPNISREQYANLQAILNKMEAVPLEYAQAKEQQLALEGKATNLGSPQVVKGKASFADGVGKTVYTGQPIKAGATAQPDWQVKKLGLGGLSGQEIAKFKKDVGDSEEQKRQFNASQKQSAEQASANRGQSQNQFTAQEKRLKDESSKSSSIGILTTKINNIDNDLKVLRLQPKKNASAISIKERQKNLYDRQLSQYKGQ